MDLKTENTVSDRMDNTERLKALVALGGTLSDADLKLENKLQICVETLRNLAKAEQASLMLVREDDLVVAAATNQGIITKAAFKDIISCVALYQIIAASTQKQIVTVGSFYRIVFTAAYNIVDIINTLGALGLTRFTILRCKQVNNNRRSKG